MRNDLWIFFFLSFFPCSISGILSSYFRNLEYNAKQVLASLLISCTAFIYYKYLTYLQLKKVTVFLVELQWMGIRNSAEMDARKFVCLFLVTRNTVNVSK